VVCGGNRGHGGARQRAGSSGATSTAFTVEPDCRMVALGRQTSRQGPAWRQPPCSIEGEGRPPSDSVGASRPPGAGVGTWTTWQWGGLSSSSYSSSYFTYLAPNL
jgi:hypothetical protein